MGYKRWTDEDERVLATRYPTEGARALSGVLGRRPDDIRHHAWLKGVRIKRSPLPPLTDVQDQIVTGSMLGDGYIRKKADAAGYLNKTQKAASREYVEWHATALSPYTLRVYDATATLRGKKFPTCTINTHCHPVFSSLRELWYPHGRKVVPHELKLTPLAMAIWFCDDGINYPATGVANICTNGFTCDEVDFLRHLLARDFGIDRTAIHLVRKREPKLYIGADSYVKFMGIIAPHVTWSCMAYKVLVTEWGHGRADRKRTRLIVSDRQVLDIRTRHRAGELQRDLAKEFHLGQSYVSQICAGKARRHV